MPIITLSSEHSEADSFLNYDMSSLALVNESQMQFQYIKGLVGISLIIFIHIMDILLHYKK